MVARQTDILYEYCTILKPVPEAENYSACAKSWYTMVWFIAHHLFRFRLLSKPVYCLFNRRFGLVEVCKPNREDLTMVWFGFGSFFPGPTYEWNKLGQSFAHCAGEFLWAWFLALRWWECLYADRLARLERRDWPDPSRSDRPDRLDPDTKWTDSTHQTRPTTLGVGTAMAMAPQLRWKINGSSRLERFRRTANRLLSSEPSREQFILQWDKPSRLRILLCSWWYQKSSSAGFGSRVFGLAAEDYPYQTSWSCSAWIKQRDEFKVLH